MFEVEQRLKGKRIVLASASPRRRELLSYILSNFEVVPAYGEEIIPADYMPMFVPLELAEQKCREVVGTCHADDDTIVIACDTAVVLDNKIYGKPKDRADAFRMLTELSGKTHFVSSGLCVYYKGNYKKTMSSSSVTFSELSTDEIKAYIATGEPMDKAGAYGIQGRGGLMVKKIVGDYYGIMGLPINLLADVLSNMIL